MSKPNTVKVRIAVAVDAEGRWEAVGSSAESDSTTAGRLDFIHDMEHRRPDEVAPPAIVWIEASVPLPRAVEGRVEA